MPDYDDNEEFDDNYDLSEGMEEYKDNPSELPWGMILLAALGGAVVYGLIKKGSNAASVAAGATPAPAEACIQIGPDKLPEYVEKGWQIYSASNSSTGGALWACPPGVNPPA